VDPRAGNFLTEKHGNTAEGLRGDVPVIRAVLFHIATPGEMDGYLGAHELFPCYMMPEFLPKGFRTACLPHSPNV